MGTPTCMTGPALSTRVPDSGGAPLATIQDSPGMGLDIDQGIQDTPILAITPVDPLLVLADQAPVLRLQRMHRHECSNDRIRSCEDS